MKYIPADKLIKFKEVLADIIVSSQGICTYQDCKDIAEREASLLIATLQQEQPEVDLEKFTEKMDAWKARYNHPDIIPIKATMAFTARMFYMYPDIAREWYDSLPKATMD